MLGYWVTLDMENEGYVPVDGELCLVESHHLDSCEYANQSCSIDNCGLRETLEET